MNVTVNSRKDCTVKNLRKVALQEERVVIGRKATNAINHARKSFMNLLGADRSQFIYATSSGAGQGASTRVPAEEQKKKTNETIKLK